MEKRRRGVPRRLGAVLCVAAGGVLAGCGGSSSPNRPENVVVDTLAGGGLVVHNGRTGSWPAGRHWRLEEELRIGQRWGTGPDAFGRISALAVDPLGRIWVVDAMSADIRVFDADGRPVRTIGRAGQGPGEFTLPMAIAPAPDGSMWVSDPRQGRIQSFDTAGALVAAHPLPPRAPPREPVVFDSVGRVLQIVTDPRRRTGAVMAIRRDPTNFQALDTLPSVEPLSAPAVFKSESSGMWLVQPIPFTRQPELHLQTGTSHFIGWPGGGDYRFGAFRLDGDTLLLIERAYEPVAIPAAALDERLAHLPGGTAAALRRGQVPKSYPAFDNVHVAPDGHWWVKRTLGPDKATFDVFAPDGVFLGPVETDVDLSRFEPMCLTDDALYGVVRDSLDTPYVVRIGIRKEGTGVTPHSGH